MADYLKSPVFSSPSYWIALGVGVVGIGAAAVQEGRKGSAAYRPYTSYGGDPYWMNAKYAGTDVKGLAFKKGERVFYYPKTKTIYAGGNAEAASQDFESMAADEDFMGGGSYNEGSAARGGHFGGKTEKEWHDDFFDRYGHKAMERLNFIAHNAELHYRPKDDPWYFGGMGGTYRSMYERILSGAKRDGVDERAAKAYAAARGFVPEPTSKRRYS